MDMINRVIQVKLLYVILTILLSNILTGVVTNHFAHTGEDGAKCLQRLMEQQSTNTNKPKIIDDTPLSPTNDGKQF